MQSKPLNDSYLIDFWGHPFLRLEGIKWWSVAKSRLFPCIMCCFSWTTPVSAFLNPVKIPTMLMMTEFFNTLRALTLVWDGRLQTNQLFDHQVTVVVGLTDTSGRFSVKIIHRQIQIKNFVLGPYGSWSSSFGDVFLSWENDSGSAFRQNSCDFCRLVVAEGWRVSKDFISEKSVIMPDIVFVA